MIGTNSIVLRITTNTIRGLATLFVLLMSVLLINIRDAAAIPIEFTFSLTKPLVHGADMLGGGQSPVIFQFRIDSDTPDLNGSSTDGLYALDYGRVQLGTEGSPSLGGIIAIQKSPLGAGFTATANGGDDGTKIGGRSLFVSYVHLFDFSGKMFSGTELPLDDAFAGEVGFGMFRLTFRPAPSDPEFQTGDYVHYDAFPISQGDFTLTRRVVVPVPEPSTIALMCVAFAALGWFRRSVVS